MPLFLIVGKAVYCPAQIMNVFYNSINMGIKYCSILLILRCSGACLFLKLLNKYV